MRLVSTTLKPKHSVAFLLLLGTISATAQQNSPYSRYGLGLDANVQNIVNKGMGGFSSAYVDAQSINFTNPASYSGLRYVTYDIGVGLQNTTLKSATPVNKYSSTNVSPSYVHLGFPISQKGKMGLVFGLKPVSTVSYSIVDRRRQVYNPLHSDSIGTLYEGDGGLYQAYSGIGKRWGGLSLGINAGYSFGRKQTNTRVSILDTVFHYQTNSQTLTSFGDWFVNAGLQYEANVGKNALLRFGVTADLGQKMKASQDISRETFAYNAVGNTNTIDSVFNKNEVEGTIQLPSSYTGGITLNTTVTDQLGRRFDKFMLGVEYQTTNWNDYTFYGQKDNVANSYMVRVGTQIVPDPLSLRNYWSRVSYRAGVYFGKDPVTINGSQLPVAAITLGAGLPIRKFRSYDYQFTVINTAFELGKRGNKDNNITESFFRFSVGLNLSDIWFQKRKYD